MLVLSRKEDQSIIFPSLGISIEVVRVQGNRVSVGVEAPKSIRVIRGELQSDTDAKNQDCSVVFQQLGQLCELLDPKIRHELKNRLNTASLSVHVAQQQIRQGGVENAARSLTKAVDALDYLNRMIEAKSPASSGDCVSESQTTYGLSANRLMNCKALIIKESDDELELLVNVLEMAGCEVSFVKDDKAAIEFIDLHGQPDVILTDMSTPRFSGPEAASQHGHYGTSNHRSPQSSTASERHIPVNDRGITALFSKSVNPKQLVQCLQEQLASAS